MVRNWRCWFREHDLERVKAVFPMVIPGSGVMIAYEPDPDGESVACRRCRKVLPVKISRPDPRPEPESVGGLEGREF